MSIQIRIQTLDLDIGGDTGPDQGRDLNIGLHIGPDLDADLALNPDLMWIQIWR